MSSAVRQLCAGGRGGGRLPLEFMRRVPLPSEGLSPYKEEIARFHSALASLAEIVAFAILGLTIRLHALPHASAGVIGLALAGLLAFAIRPLLLVGALSPRTCAGSPSAPGPPPWHTSAPARRRASCPSRRCPMGTSGQRWAGRPPGIWWLMPPLPLPRRPSRLTRRGQRPGEGLVAPSVRCGDCLWVHAPERLGLGFPHGGERVAERWAHGGRDDLGLAQGG